MTQEIYEENMVVAVPAHHPWVNRSYVGPDELKDQTMLLLGTGHCFRDQILGICPTMARFQASASTVQRTVEGSSLQTICHMVAQGLGITVLPSSAVPYLAGLSNTVKIIPFKNPTPTRRVVLVWRKSFTRMAAVDALNAEGALLDLLPPSECAAISSLKFPNGFQKASRNASTSSFGSSLWSWWPSAATLCSNRS